MVTFRTRESIPQSSSFRAIISLRTRRWINYWTKSWITIISRWTFLAVILSCLVLIWAIPTFMWCYWSTWTIMSASTKIFTGWLIALSTGTIKATITFVGRIFVSSSCAVETTYKYVGELVNWLKTRKRFIMFIIYRSLQEGKLLFLHIAIIKNMKSRKNITLFHNNNFLLQDYTSPAWYFNRCNLMQVV